MPAPIYKWSIEAGSEVRARPRVIHGENPAPIPTAHLIPSTGFKPAAFGMGTSMSRPLKIIRWSSAFCPPSTK